MNRLTIAIPTFRRPQDLKRAVRGAVSYTHLTLPTTPYV